MKRLPDTGKMMAEQEPKVEHAQYSADGTCRMKQFSNGVTEWYGSEGNVVMRIDGSEPVKQEPVAWWELNEDIGAWFLAYTFNPKAKTRPLIFGDVAPVSKREWVDLTEGEQEAIYLKCNTPSEYTNAVIAAFKEKNR